MDSIHPCFFALTTAATPVSFALSVSSPPPFAFLHSVHSYQRPCSPGALLLLLLRRHSISAYAHAGDHSTALRRSPHHFRCRGTVRSTCLLVSMLDVRSRPCLIREHSSGLRRRPCSSRCCAGMESPYVCRASSPTPSFHVAAVPSLAPLAVGVFISTVPAAVAGLSSLYGGRYLLLVSKVRLVFLFD